MGEGSLAHRVLARFAIIVLLAASFAIVAQPAEACACGGLVFSQGEHASVDTEEGVVAWDGERETMVLRMTMDSKATHAALIIPTPSPARAALADPGFFEDLTNASAPETVTEYRWWPATAGAQTARSQGLVDTTQPVTVTKTSGGSSPQPAAEAAAGASDEVGPGQVKLAPLNAKSFPASDADALTEWLRGHHYVMSDALAAAMSSYSGEGWHFIAIDLSAEVGTLDGQIQPISLVFKSTALIYPMRMSAASVTPQNVTTYVLAGSQARRNDSTALAHAPTLEFAGRITDADRRSPMWENLPAEADYLTVTNQRLLSPTTDVSSDFTFVLTTDAADYRRQEVRVAQREILGLAAGPVLLVIATVIAAAGVAGGYIWARRRKLRLEAGR